MRPPSDRCQSEFTSELPDRLALTSNDRRLESSVLLGLLRRLELVDCPGSIEGSSAGEASGRETVAASRRIFEAAQSIASFLAAEFRAESLDQKVFLAELATEMAQRIAEEFPEGSAGGRPIP